MPRYNAYILVNATNANTYIYRFSDAPATSSKSTFNSSKTFNGGIKFRGRFR